jgi:hypothetical protein
MARNASGIGGCLQADCPQTWLARFGRHAAAKSVFGDCAKAMVPVIAVWA